MDDNAIIDLYLARDEDAIKLTGEKYGSRLRSLAFHILCDHSSAEECENDTYMRTWNAIPPAEPRGYFFAYLARITRNLALNIARNSARLKRSGLIPELSGEMEACIPSALSADSRLNESLLKDALNSFLASVGKEKRIIFVRRYFYLDSIADISKRLDISESKVKTVLHRLRIQLKEHLEKEGFDL